jgi:transketolase
MEEMEGLHVWRPGSVNDSISSLLLRPISQLEPFLHNEAILREGMLRLLAIKDSDIRILTLEQSRDAVDRGLHAGGAFSATIPLVASYYGGFLRLDIVDPTRRGQDMFVLSKGHAIATLASIYADLGYFDLSILKNSRSFASILNGHPGPILPGIQVATGPMGQGIGVAQGFAIAGRTDPCFDSYCLVGDGELQEGSVWEAVMYAGQNHLDNLCVLVDRNHGQLDIHTKTVYPMPEFSEVFRSFGWEACDVDSTQYDGVLAALERFRFGVRDGKPTVIICHATKGFGAFSDFFNKHKVTVSPELIAQELDLQQERRRLRVAEAHEYVNRLTTGREGAAIRELLVDVARRMHLHFEFLSTEPGTVSSVPGPVLTARAPIRDKRIRYDAERLPEIDPQECYSAAQIITAAMKVFARDSRVVSIDSDLGTTSGLEAGVAMVDQRRALNVGVAEANMMLIGEAFAALGSNVWVSTFCPFFNWQVLRRIAVGHQERLESIYAEAGWLNEGHGLDLTFLATAANFETRTNGATHMGNDDIITFDAVGQLKIIDVSCPRQLLAVARWIMEGDRGLVYLRVMRAESAVLYAREHAFSFGKGYWLRLGEQDEAVIVSSGRAVHESLAAAAICARRGFEVGVVDMPSVDEEMLIDLGQSGRIIVFVEQNNGYLWQNFLKTLYRNRTSADTDVLTRVLTINTLDAQGKPQFIHSATYEELTAAFAMTPQAIADMVESGIAASRAQAEKREMK